MGPEKKKAIALYSGGLDSILSIKLILQQNIGVIGVYFKTPFLKAEPDHCGEKYLDISLIYVDLNKDYQELIRNPKYGFGKNINPCIDCRILMFKKAGEIMVQEKASFIISGEVLGQRPMSQNKKNIMMIGEQSGYGQWILRPLSALLLPETEPERSLLVDRNQLLDLQGRSRKRQIELARQLGIKEYPSPAGGCKLTEPGFAHRIKDLLNKSSDEINANDIEILKIGRHFNIHPKMILIVGRNERENKSLLALANSQDYLFSSPTHKGPVSLLRYYNGLTDGEQELEDVLIIASKITARYCDKNDISELVDINIRKNNSIIKNTKQLAPISEDSIKQYII